MAQGWEGRPLLAMAQGCGGQPLLAITRLELRALGLPPRLLSAQAPSCPGPLSAQCSLPGSLPLPALPQLTRRQAR